MCKLMVLTFRWGEEGWRKEKRWKEGQERERLCDVWCRSLGRWSSWRRRSEVSLPCTGEQIVDVCLIHWFMNHLLMESTIGMLGAVLSYTLIESTKLIYFLKNLTYLYYNKSF